MPPNCYLVQKGGGMAGHEFHLIGIGFAEGGIEPLCHILSCLPADLNGAFFILNHLPPDFPSFTVQVLRSHTKMPVHTGADNMVVQPGHVYCLPVNHYMTLSNGSLRLERRDPKAKRNQSIDTFLHSIAGILCRAVGILLSGSGNDGVAGLANIARAGGLTMVQEPEAAHYPQLPKAAIAAGAAIFTLAPAGIAELLTEVVKPGA
ncbi:MAG TPA: chemotaxis protein CheB [Puia sp.]|nr:chemotaxis protein CheB [Puia sp.]